MSWARSGRRYAYELIGALVGYAALVTFTYGFLQLAGAPQLSWFFVWPVYAVGWLIGLAITRRRY